MTSGGPSDATTSLGLLVYNYAFKNNQYGYANATELTAAVARSRDVAIHPHGGFGRPPKPLDAAALAPLVLASLDGSDVGAALRNFETRRTAAAARAARQSEINMALGRPLTDGQWAVRNRAVAAAAAVPAVNGFVARRFTMQ